MKYDPLIYSFSFSQNKQKINAKFMNLGCSILYLFINDQKFNNQRKMRINESKNKRMLIMEQISFRQHSRQRSRKSSAERRRKIEQSLNDFTKTMSDVSYLKTGGSEAFKYEKSSSHKYMDQRPQTPQKEQLRKEYNQVLRSPSFKDIRILQENDSAISPEKIRSNERHVKFEEVVDRSEGQSNIVDEQITYRQPEKQNKILTPNSIIENESSASAIFFTSQFNEFISKNHLQSNQNLPSHHQNLPSYPNQTQKQHPKTIEQNQSNNLTYSPQKNNSSYDNESSQRINQQNINLEEQNNHTLIQGQKPQMHQSDKKDEINPSSQIFTGLDHVPGTIQEEKQKQLRTLVKNKSGHSLAFSNQSSLKYSLNESNIKEILNRKFAHQLIADTNQFDIQNQNSSLFLHLKFQIFAQNLHQSQWKFICKSFCAFAKLNQLAKKVQKRQKSMYFQAFIINQELNLMDRKNQIKCNHYLKQKEQNLLKSIFYHIKLNFFIDPNQKNLKAILYREETQNALKQKIFRCLKIAWFDQKVKKQIEMYYLSKIFSHFTRVIKNDKNATRKKCLSFYCFNLKKRIFKHLKEGISSIQTQRIQRENADCHYTFGLQRKVFDAWKQKLSYKDRYISLAMTTKNTFKETTDQKWLQIRTVDFRQIK